MEIKFTAIARLANVERKRENINRQLVKFIHPSTMVRFAAKRYSKTHAGD